MKYISLFEEHSKNNPYIYDDPKFVNMIERTIEDEYSSFICTYVASAIKMLEGDNVKVYGFSTEQNLESEYFSGDEDEGHHFAVMDDRYIIDPWIFNNYYNYPNELFNRSVFDLKNKNDEEIIKYIYGNKDNWVNITEYIQREIKFEKFFPKSYKKLLDYYKNNYS